jgi:cytochrome c biogenesis protein
VKSHVIAFFSSLKLTIFLLITLAAVSIIGTVIPQNQFREDYLRMYDESTYELLRAVGFLNMYHSWWFTSILVLFALNLVVCSAKNFPRTWKFFRQTNPVLDESRRQTLAFERSFALPSRAGFAGVQTRMSGLLREIWGGTWLETVADDGACHWFAQRGLWSRLGVYMVHASIIIILIGGVIGSLWGVKAFVNLPEGGRTTVAYTWSDERTPVDLGFTIACESFNVEFYDTGMPKEYSSELVVYENGKERARKTIEVNHPLSYGGFTFYQSSYGNAGGSVTLRLVDAAAGTTHILKTAVGERVQLPDGGWVEVAQFEANYMNLGPAVKLVQPMADGRLIQFWIFQRFPHFDRQNRKADQSFILDDVAVRHYTGLQVARDPGVWIVWIGCSLMIVGLFIAFFVSHRRIWVRLAPGGRKGDRPEVVIAASASKNQSGCEKEFEQLSRIIQQRLKEKDA